MSRIDVRVEDILTLFTALLLTLVAGVRALGSMRIDEAQIWDIAFILCPVALLVVTAAVRYTFRPFDDTAAPRIGGNAMSVIRDWTPFLLFLTIYESFQAHVWAVVAPVDKDATLLRLDRMLFHETPSVVMDAWVRSWLTDVLALAYVLHIILPPLVALLLYRRDLGKFRALLLAILASAAIAAQGYLLLPGVGPGAAFPELYHHTLSGQTAERLTSYLDTARASRDVFPSLHVGIATIVLYYARALGKRWFAAIVPLVVAIWISTIYLRYHYLIDIFAGWATAALAIWLAGFLLRWEARVKLRLASRHS